MIVIPAIDLKDGHCVRLQQGRADAVTRYSDDPVAMAREWEQRGGKYLHVVDLDGAFSGKPVHLKTVAKITAAVSMPVELGGGMRNDENITAALEAGVARVIIGTRALADQSALSAMVQRFSDKLAVGIDARDGLVQVKGWVETSDVKAEDLAAAADRAGVATIIYTDTNTDGMLQGPNLAAVGRVCQKVDCAVIASGGVSKVADVRDLCELPYTNLTGVIVGKALYDGRMTLEELNDACGL